MPKQVGDTRSVESANSNNEYANTNFNQSKLRRNQEEEQPGLMIDISMVDW